MSTSMNVAQLCTELTRSRWPAGGWECGREIVGICVDCGTGVCIRHSDTCPEACILHTRCLENHAKQTGHSLEIPSHA